MLRYHIYTRRTLTTDAVRVLVKPVSDVTHTLLHDEVTYRPRGDVIAVPVEHTGGGCVH